MKRNLFAIFLAVTLVMALVFVIAPSAKAEDSNLICLDDNGAITITAGNKDKILDLKGCKNATVTFTVDAELQVIDTSFILDTDADGKPTALDLSGDNAGKLTVVNAAGINGTIAPVSFYGDYRYLKVENAVAEGEAVTYSFHPFNMAITRRGINVKMKTVSLEAMFIANNVVRNMITDFGIKNITKDTYHSAKPKFDFNAEYDGGKNGNNGAKAYYDLTGSLDGDLTETKQFCAYIKINGIEDPIILSKLKVDVTPEKVLEGVNAAYAAGKYTGETVELALDLYYYNEDLQEYLPDLTTTTTTSTWELVTDVTNLAVGDQIVIVAKGSDYALGTTQNSNNRVAVAVTKDGDTVTINDTVQILTLEAGTVDGTFAFYTGSGYLYAASSSSNYLRTEATMSDNSSWKITIAADGTATIEAQGTNTHNLLKKNSSSALFSCYESGQNDVAIYKLKKTTTTTHTCYATEENQATCTEAATCKYCGQTFGSALGHNLTVATCQTPAKCTREGCDYVGDVDTENGHSFPATGSHTCTNEGCTAKSDCKDDDSNNVCDICNKALTVTVETKTEELNIFANKGTLSNKVITWAGTDITFKNAQASSTTAIRTSDTSYYRVYKSSTVEISANDGLIKTIVITYTGSSYVPNFTDLPASATTVDNPTAKTYTITFNSPVSSVTLTSGAQWRLNKIAVTYEVESAS